MWVGVFDKDGMAIFVAFADADTCLGFFDTPEAAWNALKAYFDNKPLIDEKKARTAITLRRETKWGKNGFGYWVFSDTVEGMTILKGVDENNQLFYIVIDEDGNLIGEFRTLKQALAVAREASRKRARRL